MKRIFVFCLFLAAGAASLFAQAIDKPAATVRLTKPEAITVKQLRKLVDPLEDRTKRQLSKEERIQVLDNMINRDLLEQAAERDKVVVSDAELKARMNEMKKAAAAQLGRDLSDADMLNIVKSQNMTWDDYVRGIKDSLLFLNYARFKNKGLFDSVAQPTDDDARDYYEQNKTKEFVWDDTVRLRWILIDTTRLASKDERDKASKRADDINKELRGGAKFEDLVTKYSDDTSSKYRGGDVGWLVRGDEQRRQLLGSDFSDAIFALKKGETSGVVSCKVGFAIVQVTDRIDAKILGFEEKIPPLYQTMVKDFIKSKLLMQRQNDTFTKALTDIVAALRKQAEIKVFDENLSW
jgi:peptidyl-prolyl cis-trans isomerase SurA